MSHNQLYRRRLEFRPGQCKAFAGKCKARRSEGRIAEFEREIGQQALEVVFSKEFLQRIDEQRTLQALTGNPPPTGGSEQK